MHLNKVCGTVWNAVVQSGLFINLYLLTFHFLIISKFRSIHQVSQEISQTEMWGRLCFLYR